MAEVSTHRLIKKYSNRKLYDTVTRRYVTLDDIAAYVREGGEVTVVNRDTGEDLTPAILSQIVAREERRGGDSAVADGIQERGQALLEYLRRTINMPAGIVTGEVERRVGDFETLVDGALERALKRLSLPTRGDIYRLTARLEALEARVARGGAAAPARRARTEPAATTSPARGAGRRSTRQKRAAAATRTRKAPASASR